MALNKEQMREYMRKRRTEKREKNLSGGVVDDLTSDQGRSKPKNKVEPTSPAQSNSRGDVESTVYTGVPERENDRPTVPDIVGEIPTPATSFVYDKKKYPNRGAWDIAVGRVERAVRWSEKFPERISPDDLKFQTVDWQYQNEGLKSAPK